MADTAPHCIVIGAGIVGSSCAWHLSRKGANVTLIDSELPGQSTSFGNAGCICSSSVFPFSHPGAIRKVPGWLLDPNGPMRIRWSQFLQSMPWLYRFWRAGNAKRVAEIVAAQVTLMNQVKGDYDEILSLTDGDFLRKSRGMILLYDTEKDFQDDTWEYAERERLEIPWSRLSPEELSALEPKIRLGNGVAIMEPDWEHLVDPGAATDWIADAAIEQGAKWMQDRVKTASATESAVTVSTESGRTISADWLVIAGGVWSNTLCRQFGHDVPLMAKRGYHSMISNPSVDIQIPIMSASRHVLLTPMRDGLRVAGTAEFAGLDKKPDYRRAKSLLHNARHYVPDLAGEVTSEWMGQRPMMPDSLPVLGPLPGQARVLCAFGHGHSGMTQGPTTGKIISQLVYNEKPTIDLSPFSINRF